MFLRTFEKSHKVCRDLKWLKYEYFLLSAFCNICWESSITNLWKFPIFILETLERFPTVMIIFLWYNLFSCECNLENYENNLRFLENSRELLLWSSSLGSLRLQYYLKCHSKWTSKQTLQKHCKFWVWRPDCKTIHPVDIWKMLAQSHNYYLFHSMSFFIPLRHSKPSNICILSS